jgi:hypothetical protein
MTLAAATVVRVTVAVACLSEPSLAGERAASAMRRRVSPGEHLFQHVFGTTPIPKCMFEVLLFQQQTTRIV